MVDYRGPKAGLRGGPRRRRPTSLHDVDVEYAPSPRQKQHMVIHASDEEGVLDQVRLSMGYIDPGARILRVRATCRVGSRNIVVLDKEF